MTEESQYSSPTDSNRDHEWKQLLDQMLRDKILNTEQFKYFYDELSRYVHNGPVLPDEELLQPSAGRRRQQLKDLSPTQFTGSQNIRFTPFGQPPNWLSHEKAWANLIDNWTNIYNRLSKFFLRHPGEVLRDFYDCPLYRTRKWGKKYWQHFKDGFRENTSQSHPITHEFTFGDIWQESTIKEQIDQVKIKIRRYKVKFENSGKTEFHLHGAGGLFAVDHDHGKGDLRVNHDHGKGDLRVNHDHGKGDLRVNHDHGLTGATIEENTIIGKRDNTNRTSYNLTTSWVYHRSIVHNKDGLCWFTVSILNDTPADQSFYVRIRDNNSAPYYPSSDGQRMYVPRNTIATWFFLTAHTANQDTQIWLRLHSTSGNTNITYCIGLREPHTHNLNLNTQDENAQLTSGETSDKNAQLTSGETSDKNAQLTSGVTGDEDAVCNGNCAQTEADIDQDIYEIDDGASYPIIVKLNGNIIHTTASLAVGENEIVDITEAVRNLADPSSFNLEVYPDHANAVVRLDTNFSAKMWWRQHQIPGVTPGMIFIWGPPRS